MPVPTDDELQALEDRMKTVAPLVVNTLIDIIEGRKFIAVETKQLGGSQIHTLMICDNPTAG